MTLNNTNSSRYPSFTCRLIYYGHKFIVNKKEYHSGGAGYVMSRSTLAYLVEFYPRGCKITSGVEDMQMGVCMEKLGIEVGEAR